ncbi:MAG: hypothetical protein LBH10_01070, partial [Burkholderiaceae bacterium]|nr:hypothetical protein [Burkholderiaceae bacterium]
YAQIIKRYEGTRLGRQELNAEILDDNPNALWQRAMIENTAVAARRAARQRRRARQRRCGC